MMVLVSDTSVLIDLERGGLIELAFTLPYTFVVPDLLYEQELRPHGGEQLRVLGLQVEELSPAEVTEAVAYRQTKRSLSLPDSFALVLARNRQWTLLTGDGELRELGEAERVDCHGVLWVLDRMTDQQINFVRQLYDGLQAIAAHPRCWLPRREIRIRLSRFRAMLDDDNE